MPAIRPSTASPPGNSHRHRVVMLLENNPYPADVRVRREAESLVRAGHAVCVAAPRARGQARREVVAGVAVRRFRAPQGTGDVPGLLAEYAVAMVALHLAAVSELRRGATVVHLHNPPDTLFCAAALARLLGRRVVFDHHDLFPELVAVRVGSRAVAACAQGAERLTFAAAHRVLAANASHARIAQERGGKPAAAVTVVRNGPPARDLVAAPALRPGRLADPQLVYVGALAAQDGVEALAELLARLRDDHGLPGARLTVVGAGPGGARLVARAAQLGVADRMRLTGWVGPEAVLEHLRDADVCVDPAPPGPLNDRSTMIKIAEYLAAAKPVVAFALPETEATAQGAALLVAPGDAGALAAGVARLAADGAARDALARRALTRAAALTWEHSERALLAAYAAL